MTAEQLRDRHRPSLLIMALVVLCLAFLGRVLTQLWQTIAAVDFLPPFESWHSGALPYPLLLFSQGLILAVQIMVIRTLAGLELRLGRRTNVALGVFGALYFSFMSFRLFAGFTLLTGHSWFDAPLPSFFHLVLATFVILVAVAGLAPAESAP